MKLFWRYISLVIFLFFLLSVLTSTYQPSTTQDNISIPFTPDIRKTVQEEIEQYEPEIILLGNSILEKGINLKLFEELTGIKTLKISEQGTTSAYYYLMIKNNIITARTYPKYLIIFFLENLLTRPDFAVTGDYQVLLDEIAGDDEQVLWQKAYANNQNSLVGNINNQLPILNERQTIQQMIIKSIKYELVDVFLNCDEVCLDTALNDTFRYSKMLPVNTQQDLDDIPVKNDDWDFLKKIDQSFLPDFIQMTKESGIHLILVREKKFTVNSHEDENFRSREYYADLERYLYYEGIPLLNFAYEPALNNPIYFTDISHLTESGRDIFTGLIAERLLALINQP